MTPQDQIHLGSDTKAMTAILIAQLIEKGQLRYDTTMAEIFSDLGDQINSQMAKVTVEELLCHTAGLPHDVNWQAIDGSGASLNDQRLKAVRMALSAAPQSPPGTKYSYSNVGYVILGAILDRKTHRSWEELIRSNLFKPLGMTTAGFGPPGTPGQVDQPWGHLLQNGGLVPVQSDNPPVMNSCARVHCSISDWAKFISIFLPNGLNRHPLLSTRTLGQLLNPPAGNQYAGGWLIDDGQPWAGGWAYTHSGSNTYWYCTVWIAPQKNFATVTAINYGGDDAGATCNDASIALIQCYFTHSLHGN